MDSTSKWIVAQGEVCVSCAKGYHNHDPAEAYMAVPAYKRCPCDGSCACLAPEWKTALASGDILIRHQRRDRLDFCRRFNLNEKLYTS